jgi:hypothetical protein
LASLATFSPPIPATGNEDQLPRIIIGILTVDDVLVTIAVDGDGKMGLLPLTGFTVDWRYDIHSETWSPPAPGRDEEE